MDTQTCRSGRTGAIAVSEFHRRLRDRPGEAFLAVRALALSLGPDVEERVGDTSACYLRRGEPFLMVHATKSRLQVAFPLELSLPDPMGRLLKRGDERFVAVEGPETIDGHIQEFVRRSYAAARPVIR